jgi:hypothetical protein
VLLQCTKLLELNLDEWKEVLKQSGLCLYCLKHAAEVECYGQGGFSKPKCVQAGCNGEHAVSVHKLLRKNGASVNLIAEGEYESEEDKEWWVGTVRVEGEESSEEVDESELEDGGVQYASYTYVEEDNSGPENELKHFREAPSQSDACKQEEEGWWSPGPAEPSPEENEEEELSLSKGSGREPSGALKEVVPPRAREVRRRKLRKKVTRGEDHQWELARQNAWLREMLTDSSGNESEEEYTRFAESGRWIAEMTGAPHWTMTTSRGECSGQEKPES